MFGKALGAIFALCIIASVAFADEERITFPKDYNTEFYNYLSLDRVQNDDQIIRLFANDLALEAAREGRELPNGSVIVGELYKAKKDVDGNVIESSLGRRVRGKLFAVAVMEKDEGWGATLPENVRNDDWDFAIFSPRRQTPEQGSQHVPFMSRTPDKLAASVFPGSHETVEAF